MSDPIDDLIRDKMRDSFPLAQDGSSAANTLAALQPKMQRARSVRRATQASVAMIGASALVVGLLAILPQFGDAESEVNLAGSTSSTVADDPTGSKALASPASTDPLGRSIEEPSNTTIEPSATAEPRTTAEPATDAQSTVVEPTTTAEPATTVEATSAPSTTAEPATTTAAPSTTAATSTTAAPTTTESSTTTEPETDTISSSCGSIEVALVGSGIALVSTDPNSGFSVDVKDGGPSEIEVRFDGSGSDCEINTENRGGQLWSAVDNDSE